MTNVYVLSLSTRVWWVVKKVWNYVYEGFEWVLSTVILYIIIGINFRRKESFDRDKLHFTPFCLLPSPFPRQEFNRAVELQTLLNELMHKVAYDFDFLKETLRKTVTVDTFTARLFEIHEKIINEGGPAQVSSSILLR